jgi:hypothetical protein
MGLWGLLPSVYHTIPYHTFGQVRSGLPPSVVYWGPLGPLGSGQKTGPSFFFYALCRKALSRAFGSSSWLARPSGTGSLSSMKGPENEAGNASAQNKRKTPVFSSADLRVARGGSPETTREIRGMNRVKI